jgi:hypothetical protein
MDSNMPEGQSITKTPYAIICPRHKQIYLTSQEYSRQLDLPNARWECPICGATAEFDDDNYAEAYEP